MKSRRLFWQLFPSYLLISISIVVLALLYATGAFREFYLEQKAFDLKLVASLLRSQIRDVSNAKYFDLHKSLEQDAKNEQSLRVTVVDADGAVLSDTDQDPVKMDNHSDRPEVRQALRNGYGESTRYSATLDQEMMYVALPLTGSVNERQVVRVSLPVTAINTALGRIYNRLKLASFLIILLAVVLSIYISRRLSRPVEELKASAARFAKGDLEHKASVSSPEELVSLANAMNEMAGQLKGKIETVSNQKSELDVVLSCMREGVIALDTDIRIISVNKAALHLLGVKGQNIRGKLVNEVARNSELQELIRNVFEHEEPFKSEITLRGDHKRVLEINGSVLRDSSENVMGALFVIHDVTEYKRLENMRTEFVANVSHELRTPITSIKGFVETLVEGAKENPEELDRFLGIITRQADRLKAIIEDLLSLAKIERSSEDSEIEMMPTKISGILSSAVELSEVKASSKNLSLRADCDTELVATVNSQLLEQAILNLIDNAIKYSKDGDEIVVSGRQNGSGIVMSVTDSGCGIDSAHFDRLFERFYRVDKARSRKLGGTGLGLAIVKHIAQAHNGTVEVDSVPEKGSTFSIRIPPSTLLS